MPEKQDPPPSRPPPPSYLTADPHGVVLAVRVIPRSSKTALAGERAGALVVRLQAPPVEGAANAALLEFLCRCLDVPARHLTLLSGERSRDKRVRISGLTADQVRGILERQARGPGL